MEVFFISLVVFGLVITGMAVGAFVAKKPIKGTCGGLNNLKDRLDGEGAPCEICGATPAQQATECTERLATQPSS